MNTAFATPGTLPVRMRWIVAFGLLLVAAFARAERVLLVPLDSRPAAGQFAQMIGRIGVVETRFPPYETLGKFTVPGDPDAILDWLAAADPTDVTAVILSADMIAYGGLVASREDGVTLAKAEARVKRLESIRAKFPKIPFYVFSSTMRLAPTATKATAPYRMKLARLEELRDMARRAPSAAVTRDLARLLREVPTKALMAYRAARARNHRIQRELIDGAARGVWDAVVIGQDDARLYGPFIAETAALKELVKTKGAGKRTFFCEGIDQLAAVLVSRAMTVRYGWTPKVRIVASDPSQMLRPARYETKPLEEAVEETIRISGATVAQPGEPDDYALYVNAPKPLDTAFDSWIRDLDNELDQGFPVAVADVNFGADGAADPVLFAALADKGRMAKMLAYAGWNTAGNTIGTTVPAANVYLLARRMELDPLRRETAQKEFLLHRVANDYAYHKSTRPTAYRILEDWDKIARDETDGSMLAGITDFVRRDLQKGTERLFREQFLGRPFSAGDRRYVLTGLEDLHIWLPWPRVYEVRLEFRLQSRSVE